MLYSFTRKTVIKKHAEEFDEVTRPSHRWNCIIKPPHKMSGEKYHHDADRSEIA